MSRDRHKTAAAIAKGICEFDKDLTIGGILLNRVGSNAHEMLLREAFAPLGLPIVGAVRKSEQLQFALAPSGACSSWRA